MAITTSVYDGFKGSLCAALTNIPSGSYYVMLVTSSYTFSAAHRFKSDVTGEVVGTGYTAGGNAIGTVSWTYDSGTGQWQMLPSAGSVTFSSALTTWQAAGHVVYDRTPATDATRPLVCYCNYGTNLPVANGNFPITWDPTTGAIILF